MVLGAMVFAVPVGPSYVPHTCPCPNTAYPCSRRFTAHGPCLDTGGGCGSRLPGPSTHVMPHATTPRTDWDLWASRSKWPKPPIPSTPTPTTRPLHSRIFLLKGKEGTGCDQPTPTPPPLPPPLPPPHSNTLPRRSPATQCPQGRKNREGPEETGHGERDEQGEITGQGRPHSPKLVQSAARGEGKAWSTARATARLWAGRPQSKTGQVI